MPQHPTAHVCLSLHTQQALSGDVCQRPSIEACGLLLGHRDTQGNWHIEQALPLRNIYNSPVYFEFAPEDLLEAELTYPEQIVGVYHSHPTGFAVASTTDRNNMQRVNIEQQIPWLWLIISGPFAETFSPSPEKPIPGTSIVAYHHYENIGLRRIRICCEKAT